MIVCEKMRNRAFDTVKGIACLLIVCMHCEFPGKVGSLLQVVSRFCVPFFFMVSGYFCYNKDESKINFLKKIKHIAIICALATLFYCIVSCVFYSYGLTGYEYGVTKSSVIGWVLFNNPIIIARQMWYLFALLYTYIAVYILFKLGILKDKMGFIIAIVLLASYIFLTQGIMSLGWKRVPNHYYRNWLFEGVPYFLLAYYLHKNVEKLNIRNKTLIVIIALATVLVVLECFILKRDFGVNLFSIPQVIAIFIFCVKNGGWSIIPFNYIGNKHSTLVYILHPFVWHVVQNVYRVLCIDGNIIALWIMPLIVIGLTLLLSMVVLCINAQFRKIKKDND